MSEKDNENIKSAGKSDVIVIAVIQKKRKDTRKMPRTKIASSYPIIKNK
jgi:hypothetical protein